MNEVIHTYIHIVDSVSITHLLLQGQNQATNLNVENICRRNDSLGNHGQFLISGKWTSCYWAERDAGPRQRLRRERIKNPKFGVIKLTPSWRVNLQAALGKYITKMFGVVGVIELPTPQGYIKRRLQTPAVVTEYYKRRDYEQTHGLHGVIPKGARI